MGSNAVVVLPPLLDNSSGINFDKNLVFIYFGLRYILQHLDGLDTLFRVRGLVEYCTGLGLEISEKTAQGIAHRLAPHEPEACSMQRALADGRFTCDSVFERLQQTVLQFSLHASSNVKKFHDWCPTLFT